MTSRILLINFTQNEADKLKLLEKVEVHRGYLSDVLPYEKNYEDKKFGDTLKKMFKVYFPLAIHEYKAIFIKLHTVPDLEKEFADKLEPYNEKYVNDLIGYILDSNGYLVILLGDYASAVLFHLGIRGITLHQTIGRDKTVNTVNEEFNKVFEELEGEFIMPTERYITVDSEEDDFYRKFSSRFLIKNIYKNKAGDILACYHNNSMHYSDCNPAFFLLPLFRNSNLLITKLLKEFAILSPKFLPEFYEPDWQNSDKYLSQEVRSYEDKINKIVEKAKSFSVVDQGVAYLSQMLKSQDTFILEYNERLNKNLRRKDVDWSQSRVVFIADSFTRYQQNAIGFRDLPIELWEVKLYEDDLISYSQIKPLTTKASIKTVTKDQTIQKISKELIYPLDHHLNKTSPKVKEIFEKIREDVQNLGKVDEVSRKYFIGYWKENVKFLAIRFHKNHLTVWIRIQGYKLNDPKHLTKILNMKSEYWRKIYKEVRISSVSQIPDVMYLIKQAYEKAEQRV